MRKIILASGSPRRRDLMTMMGLEFDVIPSDFVEWLDDSLTPEEMAMILARGKAMTVARKYPDAIVIGSDTIVTIDGRQLAKAADDQEARAMIKMLAGKTHIVTTSLVVICLDDDYEYVEADSPTVTFKPYDEKAVDAYIATQDYRDKAGGYGIQSGAAPLVDYISGDTTSIIGLPVRLLAAELDKLGISTKPVNYVVESVRTV